MTPFAALKGLADIIGNTHEISFNTVMKIISLAFRIGGSLIDPSLEHTISVNLSQIVKEADCNKINEYFGPLTKVSGKVAATLYTGMDYMSTSEIVEKVLQLAYLGVNCADGTNASLQLQVPSANDVLAILKNALEGFSSGGMLKNLLNIRQVFESIGDDLQSGRAASSKNTTVATSSANVSSAVTSKN